MNDARQKVLMAILVAMTVAIFAAYSIAPIFGLDELYPHIFNDNALNWQLGIVAIVLVGAVYWWAGKRKEKTNDD